MKILVLGAGGIGGLTGGRLAQHGADVTFLVREKRKAQLDADGLRIESPQGNATVRVRSVLKRDAAPEYDLILLTCKAYDLEDAIDTIGPAMSDRTAVLPLLNGVAHVERLNDTLGTHRVLGGTAKMQATLTADGVVKQLNDWQTITFGEQGGDASARATTLQQLLAKTGIHAALSTNIVRDLWMKIVHLATVAAGTCLMRANIGEIVRTPDGTALLKRLLAMNAEIAAHNGHRPDDAFLATYLKLFETSDSTYEASMLRDLERGGLIESEHVLGYMLNKCRAAGLDDTLHMAAYTHVKAYEQRRDAKRLTR